MSAAALLGLFVAPLLGSTEASYELGVRTEVRATSAPFPQSSELLDGAQEIDPFASALLHVDEWTLTGLYNPRIYWFEPQPTATPNAYQRALLNLERKFEGNRRVFTSEDFGYGLNYFSPLGGTAGAAVPPGGPEPLQPVPSVEFLQYLTSNTTVGTTLELSSRWHLNGSASYIVSGGADPQAQLSIPLQRSPRADASLAYSPTRLDTLTTAVTALSSDFTSGQKTALGTLSEAWQTQLSRTLSTRLELGGAVVQNQGPIGDAATDFLPMAMASADNKTDFGGNRVAVNLSVGVEPFLDVYAAEIYERAEANVAAAFNYERWDFTASVRGTRLVTGYVRRGESLVVAQLATSRLLDKDVKIEGGVRGFWEHGLLIVGEPFQWSVFVSLTGAYKGVLGD